MPRFDRTKPTLAELVALQGFWRQHSRYRGCVGHWLMTEGPSTTVRDVSGFRNHGTLTNMDPPTDWIRGQRGHALDFDGTNDYVNVGSNASLAITNQLTVSVWANLRSSSFSNAQVLVSKENSGTSNYYAMIKRGSGGGDVFAFIVTTGTTQTSADSTTVPIADRWYHVVGTWDGATMRRYVDGSEEGTAVSKSGTMSDNGQAVVLGIFLPTLALPLGGFLDDVRIYNRPLSAIEIRSLFANPLLEFRWAWEQLYGRRPHVVAAAAPVGPSVGSLMLMGAGR